MKKSAVLCMGLMLMLPAFFSLQAAPTANEERFVEIQAFEGEVQVKMTQDEDWKDADLGMRVPQNGEIRTGKDSAAVVLLDENGVSGRVDVKSNTWIRIADLSYVGESHDKKTLLDLALGQVLVQAQKLEGESSFEVRTPTSTTSVRGTVFEVKVEEA